MNPRPEKSLLKEAAQTADFTVKPKPRHSSFSAGLPLARDAASGIIQGIGTDEIANIRSNANKHEHWMGSRPLKTKSKNRLKGWQDAPQQDVVFCV